MRVLIVEDERLKRVSLAQEVAGGGHEVVAVASGDEAMARLATDRFDAIISDLRMPGADGMQILRQARSGTEPRCEVILMTAYGNIPLAVEAMKCGAFDFVTKPFRNEDILPTLRRIERARDTAGDGQPRAEVNDAASAMDRIVGESTAMRDVKKMVTICAQSEATVLLCGETGTGKDLLASVIHDLSVRRSAPFVKVQCAALASQLIESELYGHEKGAFTGAEQRKCGRVELAQGGTLYLDDVDDIPLAQQVKLLRVIEERVFERVGGSATVQADLRIIASTKQDLLQEASKGRFRQDLYYRLNVLRIDVPPLRYRDGDVPLLVDHSLRRLGGGPGCINPDALNLLTHHVWPGNVRELAHALERAFTVGGGVVSADVVARDLGKLRGEDSTNSGGLSGTVGKVERGLLEDALRWASGNKAQAARSVGMKPSTFRDKLAKYGL